VAREKSGAHAALPSTSVVQLVAHLGYRFKKPALLVEALTHRSYSNEHPAENAPHNERLEFLGDAVLELVVRDRLLRDHPDAAEGRLSKIRSTLVNEGNLADVARQMGVAAALRLGVGEERSGGRTKDSILSDAMEAIIGGIFLDGGITAADEAVGRFLEESLRDAGQQGGRRDYKSELQELTMRRLKVVPTYRISDDRGPGREDRFEVELMVEERVLTSSHGRNKKEASQRAAAAALSILEQQWASQRP
jgi:ribonuclease-3